LQSTLTGYGRDEATARRLAMKTSNEVWKWNPGVDATTSWVGYDVEARDGRIGKIDEMSTETGRGSFVVDTGFWIFGKKRLLPAASVTSVDSDTNKVFVSLTKDDIKNAPDFDALRRDEDDYVDAYGNFYGSRL
jgi:hypothetical protein